MGRGRGASNWEGGESTVPYVVALHLYCLKQNLLIRRIVRLGRTPPPVAEAGPADELPSHASSSTASSGEPASLPGRIRPAAIPRAACIGMAKTRGWERGEGTLLSSSGCPCSTMTAE